MTTAANDTSTKTEEPNSTGSKPPRLNWALRVALTIALIVEALAYMLPMLVAEAARNPLSRCLLLVFAAGMTGWLVWSYLL